MDESGNQIAVFGRLGAGPLKQDEQQRIYLHGGQFWRASDDPFDRNVYHPPYEPLPAVEPPSEDLPSPEARLHPALPDNPAGTR